LTALVFCRRDYIIELEFKKRRRNIMARMITYNCDVCGSEIVVSETGESQLSPIYCCGIEVTEVSSAQKKQAKPKKKATKKATKKTAKKVTARKKPAKKASASKKKR
jgi:uncharacterized Zn finger protein (UPF0148 family)